MHLCGLLQVQGLQIRNYVVVVDRYTGWLVVHQSRDGSLSLVKCFREIFVNADELSSDGGTEFTTEETQQLLSSWSDHHRPSSVTLANPIGRLNQRAIKDHRPEAKIRI